MISPTRIRFLLLPLVYCLLFASCSKNLEDNDPIYIIRGNAEVQVNGSQTAIGNINGGYSALYKKIAFNISWQNLGSAPTGSSFFVVDARVGKILVKQFAVTEGNLTGLTAGEMFLTEQQTEDLLAGNWYYTVNTVEHPEGEIKGNVVVVKTQ